MTRQYTTGTWFGSSAVERGIADPKVTGSTPVQACFLLSLLKNFTFYILIHSYLFTPPALFPGYLLVILYGILLLNPHIVYRLLQRDSPCRQCRHTTSSPIAMVLTLCLPACLANNGRRFFICQMYLNDAPDGIGGGPND